MINKQKDLKLNKAISLLKGAYAIQTPDDSKAYYKDFSAVYDSIFVKHLKYIYPKKVVEEFLQYFNHNGAICDIGCGTGLIGYEIAKVNKSIIIDGVDISPEMILIAKKKNIYRSFYELDLTKSIHGIPEGYEGLLSAGTFTHGHLGPADLSNLLSLCKTNAILTIGINAKYYVDKEFEKVINELESNSIVEILNFSKASIYSKEYNKSKEHSTAIICTLKNINNS